MPCTDTLRVFVPLLCFSCVYTLLPCPAGRVHVRYLHEMLRISYCIYCNVKQLNYGDTDVCNTLSAGSDGSNLGPYFELVVKPGILGDSLTYGFTPYWKTGGYCKVVDWGDGSGEDATASGTVLTHTYAAAGTYTISIKADCYRCMFGYHGTYAPLIYDANGNWDALGNITDGRTMFYNCTNATLSLTSLPGGLTNGSAMFNGCRNATLPLTSLPDGLTGLVSAFSYVLLAEINLDDLTANAPEGGWTGVTSIENMFYNAGSGNSPGTVTGSRSAFLAKFPNVTNTTNAFYGTTTTA